MFSQNTESETDDDDFEPKNKSPMNNIKRKKVDTIEEEIWQWTETISKKLNMNTSQENINKLMESFHEFMLKYKSNPKIRISFMMY